MVERQIHSTTVKLGHFFPKAVAKCKVVQPALTWTVFFFFFFFNLSAECSDSEGIRRWERSYRVTPRDEWYVWHAFLFRKEKQTAVTQLVTWPYRTKWRRLPLGDIHLRQVRWGVCFLGTSMRQRLRSSSQGSSKFLEGRKKNIFLRTSSDKTTHGYLW